MRLALLIVLLLGACMLVIQTGGNQQPGAEPDTTKADSVHPGYP